jgi:hypothetical protein
MPAANNVRSATTVTIAVEDRDGGSFIVVNAVSDHSGEREEFGPFSQSEAREKAQELRDVALAGPGARDLGLKQ